MLPWQLCTMLGVRGNGGGGHLSRAPASGDARLRCHHQASTRLRCEVCPDAKRCKFVCAVCTIYLCSTHSICTYVHDRCTVQCTYSKYYNKALFHLCEAATCLQQPLGWARRVALVHRFHCIKQPLGWSQRVSLRQRIHCTYERT